MRCAHCGETRPRDGFVALTEEATIPLHGVMRGARGDAPVRLPPGALLAVECARELRELMPETTAYLLS